MKTQLNFSRIFAAFLMAFTLISVTASAQTATQLTAAEREFAAKHLSETEALLQTTVKGLSKAQLSFKPSAEKWSVEEGVKHIAASEIELWKMVAGTLEKPANPTDRAKIQVTDQQLVEAVEDRTHKSKTFAALEPKNSIHSTEAEAMKSFIAERAKLINFVKTSNADLRNHVAVLELGTFDSYQLILLISAHTRRHTSQIKEVMADPNFPKK